MTLEHEDLGAGQFKVLIGRDVQTFDHWDEIPATFDNIILFAPYHPPGPHDEHEHEEIAVFADKLRELMKRETGYAGRNKNR